MNRLRVGVLGCGSVSAQYLRNAPAFDVLEMAACADFLPERAEARAREFGLRAVETARLLADPDIDVVLNLTPPKMHAPLTLAALQAGKHVYTEKPLADSREAGRSLVEAAAAHGRRLGCAPDTFLGSSLQTCRKVIDDGWIGEPVAAASFMISHGEEDWHPDPDFYFKAGAGPMLDMGPYYMTTLIHLLGPAVRVSGSTRLTFPERTITSQPRFGQKISVETQTHYSGVIDFECGAVVTSIQTYDVWASNLPHIEIYGSEGTLSVPDPNQFDDPVRVWRSADEGWVSVPPTHAPNMGRGVGLADLAHALRHDRPHRAAAECTYHVLDILCAFEESSVSNRHIDIQSRCSRPAPLPLPSPSGAVRFD